MTVKEVVVPIAPSRTVRVATNHVPATMEKAVRADTDSSVVPVVAVMASVAQAVIVNSVRVVTSHVPATMEKAVRADTDSVHASAAQETAISSVADTDSSVLVANIVLTIIPTLNTA